MKRTMIPLVTLAALFAYASAAAADTFAITGGTVYPVSGPRINNGTVVVRDGTIVAVGAGIPIPAGARRIDARGKIVTPGLINAQTNVGLVEVGGERATDNSSARGFINAAFRPWDGLNSESALIPATREDGVTTLGVVPSGGLISGQAAFVDLRRGPASAMVLRGPVAMVASLQTGRGIGGDADETAGAPTDGSDQTPVSRGEAFMRLRALLDDVRAYAANGHAYNTGALRELGAARTSLAALVPVVRGTLPLVIEAHRVDDIDAAIHFAREQHVRLIISGGDEGWEIASEIAAAHVPVICGAMNNIPQSFDNLNSRQENAALLRRAGVEVVLVGNTGGGDDESGFNARNVRYEAGNAVAYGMRHDDALRAITLAPALVFGVADRVGALRSGNEANIVVWSGDPFEFSTRAEAVFVHGEQLRDRSRQDQLIDRYRQLPPAGRAPGF